MTNPIRQGVGRYRLPRHRQSDYATYGRIYHVDGTEVVVTLERPWVEDPANPGHRHRLTSRFAPGTYRLELRKSHLNGGTGKRDYDVWEFVGVPDCDDAQLHIGCFPSNFEGCVGVGSAFGNLEDPAHDNALMPCITGSKNAFDKWMTETAAYAALEIEVIDAFSVEASA